MKLNVKQAGLSLGILIGVLHLSAVLFMTLSSGAAVEYWMTLHHVRTVHTYLPLDITNLVIGTIGAVIIGAITGSLFAIIWNSLESGK